MRGLGQWRAGWPLCHHAPMTPNEIASTTVRIAKAVSVATGYVVFLAKDLPKREEPCNCDSCAVRRRRSRWS